MRRVSVLFYRNDSWLSRLIRRITRAQFSHVGIALPDRLTLFEALGSGIVIREGLEYFKRREQAAASVNLTVSDGDYLQMMLFLNRRIDRKYGLINLIAAGVNVLFPRLPLVMSDGRKYICSGLVAEALCKGDFDFDEPALMTPGDLARELGVTI